MTRAGNVVADRIERLRAEFDRSFAEPARSHDEEYVELLAVQAGGRRYAIRLSETAGLHPDRPVTPLPGPLPALLGLAGFAGQAVPVYDLGALLGHPVTERPRWLVLAAGTPALGLAFHDLDGHIRVPAAAVVGEGFEPGPSDGAVPRPAPGPTDGAVPRPAPGPTDGAVPRPAPGPMDGAENHHKPRISCVRGMVALPDGARQLVDVPGARAAVHALTGHAHVTGEETAP